VSDDIDLGMNERAWALADAAATRAAELRISVDTLPCGARVIDAGIDATGGFGAGLLLAELCMGGLGRVGLGPVQVDGESWPGVHVWTDHPAHACIAAQYAGWSVDPEGYFAMGSGPLRARARVERELFERLGYAEQAARGVLVLETRARPGDAVATWVARKAGLPPQGVTLAVAPTASLAGGVQVVARVIETGLHKMKALDFDVRRVVSATGTAPLPPPAKRDLEAIGRTNDSVLYGGRVHYIVDAADEDLAALVERLPSSASRDHGTPFSEVFERYDRDFYRIDAMLFSPAEVWLTSTRSGRTVHAGRLEPGVLRASLYGRTPPPPASDGGTAQA
jgi:methenyltetrahydromethanopterin cyclohydrolase